MLKSILILVLLSLCLGTAAWLFFIYVVKRGGFDDVERAKYRMLEDNDEHDRAGRNVENTTDRGKRQT
jgi:cbb3-type cytochrome oxidase maturation protein